MERKPPSILRRLIQGFFSGAGAIVVTLGLFLILPVMETIGGPGGRDIDVRSANWGKQPPPPPPPPEMEEEEKEPPPPPPKLEQPEAQPLDLSQLQLALNPGAGTGSFGDFTINLPTTLGGEEGSEETDKIFSLAELDQRPRVLFQRMPRYPPEPKRKKRPGTVYIVFMVDKNGRVVSPKVQKSSDPVFDAPALEAVRQWKFEPGTRNGQKVQFKMRVPITFNAG